MELLTNGVLYSFLISICGNRLYIDDPRDLDWIPILMRMQLVTWLDKWKAAEMRLEWFRNLPETICRLPETICSLPRGFLYLPIITGSREPIDPDMISSRLKEEVERHWNCLYTMFREALQDAGDLRRLNAQHDILTPPVPDLEFWKQVSERALYESRLAVGEPVTFYKGRCCLRGSVNAYVAYSIVPGPYPGMQYYRECCGSYDMFGSPRFWNSDSVNVGEQRLDYEPDSLDWAKDLEPMVYRQELAGKGIIGPVTYAELVRQQEYEKKIRMYLEDPAMHPEDPPMEPEDPAVYPIDPSM